MLNLSQQQKLISDLFTAWRGERPSNIYSLPPSGSDRQYFRIQYNDSSLMGVYNPIEEENAAFLQFTKHFAKQGIPVPRILNENTSQNVYFLEDLGNATLFSLLPHKREQVYFENSVMEIYKRTLDHLPVLQIKAAEGLNFSLCFPRSAFDRNSMMWDLNYFKYYFLKLAGIQYDEQKLEDSFHSLCDFLLLADNNYFMYRDFQSRNIMLKDSLPWFIDYQGGRKGPLQYDIASLLYDAKANMHPAQREELLNYYMEQVKKIIPLEENTFRKYFYGFVLIRILQAMGAYGFRGFYENKTLFLQSIPYAQRNLLWLLENSKIPEGLDYLKQMITKIIDSPNLKKYDQPSAGLKVSIHSFSYKKGFPNDDSGNGGGFVFDCRSLPNPGRQEQYKRLTGKDTSVIAYLEQEPAVGEFIENTSMLVEKSVEAYLDRGFSDLMVCYGCTGGQHRSVYSAEKLAQRLLGKYDIKVDLQHKEANSWPL